MGYFGVDAVSNIHSLQNIAHGRNNTSTASPGRKTGDTVCISPEAMGMLTSLRTKTPEEKYMEDSVTSWFEQTKGGFTEYKSDYSKWSEGNTEQKKRYEAEIATILAQEGDGKELSQKDLTTLDELRKKLNVLESLADKMVVDTDTMEYALNHLGKLETEWQKAHPEKSMLQAALDKWRDIDPEKLEEEIKEKQVSLLAEPDEEAASLKGSSLDAAASNDSEN